HNEDPPHLPHFLPDLRSELFSFITAVMMLRVMVNIGETASFSCEYSQNHINDPKIIFKEGKDSIETIYSRWKKKERFSISDDKHKNIFIVTVSISNVSVRDAGVYWCGAETRDTYLTFISLNTKIQISLINMKENLLRSSALMIQSINQSQSLSVRGSAPLETEILSVRL
uniref:Ig-like domain-containing protein n=1 Tax=Cyprinus carpio TaxID=7962 RepID=A0A8C2JKP3_CYPCA